MARRLAQYSDRRPVDSSSGLQVGNSFLPSDPDAGSDLTAASVALNLSPTVIEAAAVVGAIALGWLLLPSRA